jgi:hypothetical protein
MTVDSLHASFQRVDSKVKHMIEKGCTNHSLEDCIRRLWSQQFHHDLSKAALAGMIMHYRALYKTKKTRKQVGGQTGGLAPLEYSGGQGADVVYGRFPVFEGGSPAFVRSLGGVEGQRFNESSIGTTCTKQQGGRSTRSKKQKQQGGGIFDDIGSAFTGGGVGRSIAMGHPFPSVPSNPLQNTVTAVQGRPSARNGDPTAPGWSARSFDPRPYDAQSAQIFNITPVYTGYGTR